MKKRFIVYNRDRSEVIEAILSKNIATAQTEAESKHGPGVFVVRLRNQFMEIEKASRNACAVRIRRRQRS